MLLLFFVKVKDGMTPMMFWPIKGPVLEGLLLVKGNGVGQ